MSIKSWLISLSSCLVFCSLGCEDVASTQAGLVEAAVKGDLKEFKSFFTTEGQEIYGHENAMLKFAALAKENQEVVFSHDHDYQWMKRDNKDIVKSTGLAVLKQKNGDVLWISSDLECESITSISDSHPWPVDCKISKLNDPHKLSASYANAKLVLYGHTCNSQKIRELIFDEPLVNPNVAPFANSDVTALSALTSRMQTDRGHQNQCEISLALLKQQ
ncbi:MAG: hypothetical protein AABY64_04025 [Bdellovibrionota bacterium]